MIEKNSQKNRNLSIWDKLFSLVGWKQQNSFQWTHKEHFFVSTEQAGKQASKQVDFNLYLNLYINLSQTFRYFSAFWIVISVEHFVLIILGKFLFDFSQLLLIFNEFWSYIFLVSRKDFQACLLFH